MNNNNNNNNQTKSRKDELGALWKKKSKTGMSFLSGYVKVDDLGLEKEIKVVVFANNKKSNEKAPDYRIYVSKPLESESDSSNSSDAIAQVKAPQVPTKKAKQTTPSVEEESQDEIL